MTSRRITTLNSYAKYLCLWGAILLVLLLCSWGEP